MQDQKRIYNYCENHSSPPGEVLQELERETNLKTLAPQMLTGHIQGQLLSLISGWIRPLSILEIGTFTGYGTICLAKGLKKEGVIHTIEVNQELTYISQKYFRKAGIETKIRHYIGDAAEVIPQINDVFDIVYLDAGKQEYGLHYDLVLPKLRKGGIIIADNVLWGGKVGTMVKDKDTSTIESFNSKIQNDDRVHNLLLPIRDGLMIVTKK